MAKISRKVGRTSQIVQVFVLDTTSTTGAGKTGLTNASFTCYYKINTGAASVAVTLDASSGVTLGTYEPSVASHGAIKEVDSTNMPGDYEFHIPNNALVSGDEVVIMLTGTGIRVAPIEIELTGTDNQDGVRGGMTALPNAAAAASGGLPTIGATIPNATAGAAGGLFIAGSNAATTITGTAASGASPATAALTLIGGSADTTGGGTAGAGLSCTGGAGAASTNGAAVGATFAGGGTNTVASAAHGISTSGTSTGSGLAATSGGGLTGDGITATAASTNGNGLALVGIGSGDGLKATPGATGHGVEALGGATSGSAVKFTGTAGNAQGLQILGQGSAAGMSVNGGATGSGVSFVGGASAGVGLSITTTSGDGLSILPTGGNAITATGQGTGHGAIFTSGSGATGDGLKAVAASSNGNGVTFVHAGSGSDLNATTTPLTLAKTTNITGFNDVSTAQVQTSCDAAITANATIVEIESETDGIAAIPTTPLLAANVPANFSALLISAGGHISNVDTLTTYTGDTPQTGDVYGALTGANTELTSVPASTASLVSMLKWLFMLGRNKRTQTATTELVRNDGDSATVGTSTKSDDGTTFVRSKYV